MSGEIRHGNRKINDAMIFGMEHVTVQKNGIGRKVILIEMALEHLFLKNMIF